MPKIKRRKGEVSVAPSPALQMEYFFRLYYGTRWHIGFRKKEGMRTRCGKLISEKVLVRPAGGIDKCPACFKGSKSSVNTDTQEEWSFERAEE